MKILVELDLTKPLLRETRLKYKQTNNWVDFKYEQLSIFCFYCSIIGYNERIYSKRKQDLSTDCVRKDQFGHWLRAGGRNIEGRGYRGSDSGRKNRTSEVAARGLMLGVDKGRDMVHEHIESEGDKREQVGSGGHQEGEGIRESHKIESRGEFSSIRVVEEVEQRNEGREREK